MKNSYQNRQADPESYSNFNHSRHTTPPTPRTNKYLSICSACGNYVKANQGLLIRKGEKFLTIHKPGDCI